MCKSKDDKAKVPEIRKKNGYQPIAGGYQHSSTETVINEIPEGGSGCSIGPATAVAEFYLRKCRKYFIYEAYAKIITGGVR